MSASLVTAAIFGVKKRKNTEKENIGHFFFSLVTRWAVLATRWHESGPDWRTVNVNGVIVRELLKTRVTGPGQPSDSTHAHKAVGRPRLRLKEISTDWEPTKANSIKWITLSAGEGSCSIRKLPDRGCEYKKLHVPKARDVTTNRKSRGTFAWSECKD